MKTEGSLVKLPVKSTTQNPYYYITSPPHPFVFYAHKNLKD